ncbi:MAG: hypothetical protein R2713_12450 [Ilumatobacteraceae bacterium]
MDDDEVGPVETETRLHEDDPLVVELRERVEHLPFALVQRRGQALQLVHRGCNCAISDSCQPRGAGSVSAKWEAALTPGLTLKTEPPLRVRDVRYGSRRLDPSDSFLEDGVDVWCVDDDQ